MALHTAVGNVLQEIGSPVSPHLPYPLLDLHELERRTEYGLCSLEASGRLVVVFVYYMLTCNWRPLGDPWWVAWHIAFQDQAWGTLHGIDVYVCVLRMFHDYE